VAPETCYSSFEEVNHAIIDYIFGYCSWFRRHAHNLALPPNKAGKRCWYDYKAVAKKT